MSASRPELRGLLLDFDGTIAETERCGHRVAYNRAFVELGLDWQWDEHLYGELLAVAGGRERLRHFIEQHDPRLPDDAASASSLIARIHEAKIRHFATIAPTIGARPGVLRLLREAAEAGIRTAIATTAARAGVEAILASVPGLSSLVTLVAANDVVERMKPAPDVYLWALAQLRLPASECVAIEDSNVGLRAAMSAGLATVVTVSDYTSLEDFSGARAVLADLGEPDAPARSIRGMEPSDGVVDIDFLRTVLSSTA